MADLAERLAELAPDIDHDLARAHFDRARRARRNRRRIARATAGAAAVLTVGLAIGILDLGSDSTTAVTSTGDTTRDVHLVDLQGRDTHVALPPTLSKDFQVQALHAEIDLGPSRWRVDVARSDNAAATDETDCQTPPDTVTGRVRGWHITFSGDGMTPATCRALVEELDDFRISNGVPAYLGTTHLGPIDDPDVAATSASASFSLFHRSPTCAEDAARTKHGLVVERIDDPAREMPLTVLCDPAASIELWIQSPTWPSDEEIDAIEITASSEGAAAATSLDVETYDLDLTGADLVADRSLMAAGTDVALWANGQGMYVALSTRPGLTGTYGAPSGLGPMTRDDEFPNGAGQAWLSEPQDPRGATMWWLRPSGDLWIVRAHWYGDTVVASPEATLRDWALAIENDPAANPPYVMNTPNGLTMLAFEPAGDRPSRTRTWDFQEHQLTVSVVEASGASGRSNLLARGAPAITNVPSLGEVWSVGTTFGWAVPGSDGAWATLEVPDAVIPRADDILRALRPTA